jgi:hypothetical protein
MSTNALLVALCGTACAAAAPNAREIMEEVQRRSLSKNFRYEGRITTRKVSGAQDEKTWRYERLGAAGQSKVLLRFLDPAEIRGVTLLVWNHPQKASDIWLFTPSLGRNRRVAQQDRSTRFAGTDFSFEDFEESDASIWDYSELQEEQESGEPCWRVSARRSQPSRSQYDKYWIWVSKAKMTPLRVDKWRGGKVAQRISMRSLEQRQGFWTPMLIEVADLSKNSTTTLRLTDARYDERMSESHFTLEAMKGSR